jgi:hypothetical protein
MQLNTRFNLRYWGRSISIHAARNWLLGVSLPRQDKLRVLADWLRVSPEALLLGAAPITRAAATGAPAPGLADQRMILKTAVERARQCRDRRVRQGARTRRATARKDEQRRMARRARRWRVRSILTQAVNVNEAAKVNIHAVLVKVASGQLPFLG